MVMELCVLSIVDLGDWVVEREMADVLPLLGMEGPAFIEWDCEEVSLAGGEGMIIDLGRGTLAGRLMMVCVFRGRGGRVGEVGGFSLGLKSGEVGMLWKCCGDVWG
jgi:hypothetical protein